MESTLHLSTARMPDLAVTLLWGTRACMHAHRLGKPAQGHICPSTRSNTLDPCPGEGWGDGIKEQGGGGRQGCM